MMCNSSRSFYKNYFQKNIDKQYPLQRKIIIAKSFRQIHLQTSSKMIKLSYSIYALAIYLLIQIITCSLPHKCYPNSNMKYELNYTHQLKGYHSMCSQFSKRTCCSGKNFEALAKKISSKLIGSGTQSHPLSHLCRRRLTTLLCSTCDGDIGQKAVDGVCTSVCRNVYEACKQDYFSIDSLNKIKVCKDDDIICSKLVDILPEPLDSDSLCHMLGIDTDEHDCWTGVPSWRTKGIPKIKAHYHVKPTRPKSSLFTFPSFFNFLFKIQKRYWVYISLVSLLLGFLTYKWLSIKIRNEARKIKNL